MSEPVRATNDKPLAMAFSDEEAKDVMQSIAYVISNPPKMPYPRLRLIDLYNRWANLMGKPPYREKEWSNL